MPMDHQSVCAHICLTLLTMSSLEVLLSFGRIFRIGSIVLKEIIDAVTSKGHPNVRKLGYGCYFILTTDAIIDFKVNNQENIYIHDFNNRRN